MASKSARQIKSRWQFAAGISFATALCLVSAWVVHQRFTTSAIMSPAIDPLPSTSNEPPKTAIDQPTTAPSVEPTPTATLPAVGISDSKRVGTIARYGVLRVGNPTSYPVRVALLSRKEISGVKSASTKADQPFIYDVPAHWDFAPEEGGAKGLLVSLPDRTLKLKKGDVLVAFAQDGSGRYWGPYVVDETAVPAWNAKAVEWQLILQP